MRLKVSSKSMLAVLLALAAAFVFDLAARALFASLPAAAQAADIAAIVLFIVLWVWCGHFLVHSGWFPADNPRKDPFICRTIPQLWCNAAHSLALEEMRAEVDKVPGWPLIGGARPNPGNRKRYRAYLQSAWGISDRAGGLEAAGRLLEGNARDMCRGALALSMCFVAGYLSREELEGEYRKANALIHDRFSSWEELSEDYLAHAPEALRPQLEAYYGELARLAGEKNSGPYSIPWGAGAANSEED